MYKHLFFIIPLYLALFSCGDINDVMDKCNENKELPAVKNFHAEISNEQNSDTILLKLIWDKIPNNRFVNHEITYLVDNLITFPFIIDSNFNECTFNNMISGRTYIFTICIVDSTGNKSSKTSLSLTPLRKTTITYDFNIPSDVTIYGSLPVDSNIYFEGDLISILGDLNVWAQNDIFHANFIHWNTQSDGKGITYYPKSIMINKKTNITLYAIWKVGMK